MRQTILAAMLALPTMATLATAEPIAGDDARKLLFNARGVNVVINGGAGLSDQDGKTLEILVTTNGFKYYGAIAFSPDEGIMSEALQGAFNYHDAATASAAALGACNELRKRGTQPCQIAAQLLPRRYKARPFQLSQDGTAAFDDYRRAKGEKAIAVSTGTGSFGIGTGETAEATAIAACNQRAPKNDCVIAVRN